MIDNPRLVRRIAAAIVLSTGVVATFLMLSSTTTKPTPTPAGVGDRVHLQPRTSGSSFQPVVLSTGRVGQMPIGDTLAINGSATVTAADLFLAPLVTSIGTTAAPGALRGLIGSTGQVVNVQYFTNANDGGGGLFYWDTSSSTGDDGGTIGGRKRR